MSPTILITGAAGYIGGSVLEYLRTLPSDLLGNATIVAAVRSSEQAAHLRSLKINVAQVDLEVEEDVAETVRHYKVNIIIHCASGLAPRPATNLIAALGRRRKESGEAMHFIHTSGGSAFSERSGWPSGQTKDTDAVFQREKELADTNPIRKVDVLVTEQAALHDVKSYIVVPTLVYGKGLGSWNKLSVCLPRYIKASIAHKTVYKFEDDLSMPAVHLSDLLRFYSTLIESIVREKNPPSGEDGIYFVVAHQFRWYATLTKLAEALYAHGLVTNTELRPWPSDEVAADLLGLPASFVHMIWNSRTDIISEKGRSLGWQPEWNNEAKYLQTMDDEVAAVQEVDDRGNTVFSALT